ncbi:MAG: hypothetical protein AAFO06_12315 [Cyanobacteria bacterium J06597_16]
MRCQSDCKSGDASIRGKAIWRILGGAGLSLLISCGYPLISADSNQVATAQAQTEQTQAQKLAQAEAKEMTLTRLEAILQSEASDIQGEEGQWQLTIGNRSVVVLADVSNNRMRIVAPIVAASELSAEQVQAMLLANFHTALDARYALSDDTVVSVFVHPLASLEEGYLRSALSQVATAADNFGTTYSSGGLGFGPNEQSTPDELPAGGGLSI